MEGADATTVEEYEVLLDCMGNPGSQGLVNCTLRTPPQTPCSSAGEAHAVTHTEQKACFVCQLTTCHTAEQSVAHTATAAIAYLGSQPSLSRNIGDNESLQQPREV